MAISIETEATVSYFPITYCVGVPFSGGPAASADGAVSYGIGGDELLSAIIVIGPKDTPAACERTDTVLSASETANCRAEFVVFLAVSGLNVVVTELT